MTTRLLSGAASAKALIAGKPDIPGSERSSRIVMSLSSLLWLFARMVSASSAELRLIKSTSGRLTLIRLLKACRYKG